MLQDGRCLMAAPNWPDMPEPKPVVYLSWEDVYDTLKKLDVEPSRERVLALLDSKADDMAQSDALREDYMDILETEIQATLDFEERGN